MSRTHPDTWRLISFAELPSDVRHELDQEQPNKNLLRGYLLDAFRSQNVREAKDGENFESDLLSWLWFQTEDGDGVFSVMIRRWPRLQYLLFKTFSNKVGALSQRHCPICHGVRATDDQFPVWCFPIRITPISRQATKSELFKAYKSVISDHFKKRQIEMTHSRLCLAVTFVLDSLSRDRDIDNMLKALLDALASALGFDDRHIHHVDAIKLAFPEAEECLYVRVAPSFANEHDDVVIQEFRHTWASQEALDFRSLSGQSEV